MIKRKALFLGFYWISLVAMSQNPIQITCRFENQTLAQVFESIQSKYDLQFNFTQENISENKVSISASSLALSKFLDTLLHPLYLDYELVNNRYVLIKNQVQLTVLVQDTYSNTPIPFAHVTIPGQSAQGITNENGRVDITVEYAKNQFINISHLSYQPLQVALNSIPFADPLVFFLEPAIKELEQVMVFEYLNQGVLLDPNTSSNSLRPEIMEIMPGLAESDILLSAQMLPGIQSADESASGINVRGGTRDQTLYYWNEIPVYHQAHYFGNIGAFIPASVGTADIYKSYIPVQYGGVTAGLFILKSPEKPKTYAEANLTLTHYDLFARTVLPKKAGNLVIGWRRSLNDLLLTPTYQSISEKVFEGSNTALFQDQFSENTFDYNSQIIFNDFVASWELKSGKSQFEVSFLRSDGLLDFDTERDGGIDQAIQNKDVSNEGISTKWTHQWTNASRTTISWAYSKYKLLYFSENIDRFLDRSNFESRRNTLRNLDWKMSHNWIINSQLDLIVGSQLNAFQTSDNTFSRDQLGTEIDVFERLNNHKANVFASYAALTASWNTNIELTGSLRMSQFELSDKLYLNPQLRWVSKHGDQFSLKFTAGHFQQFLSARPENNFTLSNSPEQLWQVNAPDQIIENTQMTGGFSIDIPNGILDVEVYQKQLKNLNMGRIALSVDDDWVGNEAISGVDIFLRNTWGKFNPWISYSYQHSSVDLPSLSIFNVPSLRNVAHQFQNAVSYTEGPFEISLGYTFKSGLPFTPSEGIETIETDGFVVRRPTQGNINSARLPNYNRLDLSVCYRLEKESSRIKWEAGISLINVTNQQNVFRRTFLVDDDEDGEYILIQRDHITYGFTPNMSLRMKFQ
jgi:hypothetical protein